MKANTMLAAVIFLLLLGGVSYAGCGTDHKEGVMKTGEKVGVTNILYEEFMEIKRSGEDYVLLDALSVESYNKGHIEGARSMPLGSINEDTAAKAIGAKDAKVVVYCGSFMCPASTKAAEKLMSLGYTNVLDYKGGLQEWQEKGNKLVN